jgi:glutaredoxin
MVLCFIAFFVFAGMSIFSAKYRPIAKEAFQCVFKTIMLKPCDTGLDDRIKADIVAKILKFSPSAARFTNKHYTFISWIFVLLTFASFGYSVFGVYNFYFFGNCDGPESTGVCILNDLTGDYGRFSDPKELIAPTNFDGITAGNPNASVVIVEFGCFVCPYTKEAETTMQELVREEDIYYVFKPFPLPQHSYSFDAANAVLCAEKQNMSTELRSKVFTEQEVCHTDGTLAIKELAKEAGLNMAEFNQCYDNNETGAELNTYIQQGKDSHIYATPTFFVNGKPVVGPKSLEEFKKIIGELQ